MKKYIFTVMIICFFMTGCTVSSDRETIVDKNMENIRLDVNSACTPTNDPMNAVYIIGNKKIPLADGRHEASAAPGSATKVVTSIYGRPVHGNIDGKGGTDTALVLAYDSGGSGTFYYVAAALNENGIYKGSRATLLGDRIAVKDVRIRNGVIIINYTDRKPDDPMSAPPSVDKLIHLVVVQGVLKEISLSARGEKIFDGWVTIGHEVRSFIPCSQEKEIWLQGKSPALNEIKAAYQKNVPASFPYAKVFMTLAGKKAGPLPDGFGLDYDSSFFATQLVQVFPKGNCKSDLIWIDTPLSGTRVSSPLQIQGYARGNWFFEGDFPILLMDTNGKVLARGYGTAKSAWMTEMFVPFESVIKFKPQSPGGKGILVLKKDNPTDQPEFDNELKIPIFFN